MDERATPDTLASELSARSLLGRQNSLPDGKENELVDAKRAGFMAPTQSSLRKKDLVPGSAQPLANRMNSAKMAIPEEAPMEAADAPAAPVARSLHELRCRYENERR